MARIVTVVVDNKEPEELGWYEFDQNNSGGSFDVDDDVTHRIYIQAFSYKEAEDKALDLGVYFNGVQSGRDCDCCGDRWHGGDKLNFPIDWGKYKKFTTIEEYVQYMVDEYPWCSPDAYIYYANGSKAAVYSDKYPKKE